VLACTVMLARVAAVILALHRELFESVWPGLTTMALPGVGYSLWFLLVRGSKNQPVEAPRLNNPLSLGIAIQFGAIYALVTLLVRAVTEEGITKGLFVVSFLSGLTDVDAITLSTIDASKSGQLAGALAARVVILAATANTLLKLSMALTIGSPELRRRVAAVLMFTLVAGLLSFVWF
jgi:uncharacterized membrane protein (DUF4010 family)